MSSNTVFDLGKLKQSSVNFLGFIQAQIDKNEVKTFNRSNQLFYFLCM